VAKISTINDDSHLLHGLSAAARFLECAENTVLVHAKAGRIAHIRDTAGRRLFTLAGLRKFKASGIQYRKSCGRLLAVRAEQRVQ
jgi:hypothetical protein